MGTEVEVEFDWGLVEAVSIPIPAAGKRSRTRVSSVSRQRMKYASPKPMTIVGRGSGSGLWTGCQGDQTLLNACMPSTKRAEAWVRKHGSLVDAPADVIGKRALLRAVRAVRDNESENCPLDEVAHWLEDMGELSF